MSGREASESAERVEQSRREVDVVVIGAGQAGLSSAFHLRQTGFEPHREFVVFDRAPGPGGAWQHRWPSLRLGAVHGVHDLPGLPLTDRDGSKPAREVVAEYFSDYERAFELPVLRPVRVFAVRPGLASRLLVDTSAGLWSTRALINATGTWSRPFWPHYPGRELFQGRQMHAKDYDTAEELRGQHILVIGGGITAVELVSEVSEVTATTWVTRRPPVFTYADFTAEDGRAAVAEVDRRVRAGELPGSVVSTTGLPDTPAICLARARGHLTRLPIFDHITSSGVAWRDGSELAADVLIWATGFRPALGHLAPLGLREPSGGIRVDGTQAVSDARVHLVGYGPSASTIGANRAGRSAVRELTQFLA